MGALLSVLHLHQAIFPTREDFSILAAKLFLSSAFHLLFIPPAL
jgi:hypothetical protein